MYDRLTGTPASDALLTQLEPLVQANRVDAALFMLDPAQAHSSGFYNVVLKNFATPWTNRDQTVFAALNDYSATVIGTVRDNYDFREILWQDRAYVGSGVTPAYSNSSNAHYEALENSHLEMRLTSVLQERPQSSLNGLPSTATAGVITSRAASEAFFIAGTNRAMFRFTLLNHLCRDMEQMQDTSRPPDRIRQDVTRSPGGDSNIFLNNCIGCHSGMDPMAQAFAYYNFEVVNDDPTTGRLVYTQGVVQPKYLINSDNFKPGYVTPDDSWENRWRLPGQNNVAIGWANADGQIRPGNGMGTGAKSLGQELANSGAFAQCQVEKAFKTVCFRSPSDSELTAVASAFQTSNGSLRRVFAEAVARCAGP